GGVDGPLDGSEAVDVGRREGGGGTVGEVEADPRVVPGEGAVPGPEDLAAREELVEEGADGLVEACGEDERLEGTGGYRCSAQLLHDPEHAVAPPHPSADALPRGEEARVLPGLDGFDLVAQRRERAAAQEPEHLGVAELTSSPAALDR